MIRNESYYFFLMTARYHRKNWTENKFGPILESEAETTTPGNFTIIVDALLIYMTMELVFLSDVRLKRRFLKIG